MRQITTNQLEKQIVWATLENFMTVNGHIAFQCDEDSIVAFITEAFATLDTYQHTNNDVQGMRNHALHLIADAFANLRESK